MDIESKITLFEEKIEEYYLSCLPRQLQLQQLKDKSFLQGWPIYRFNIQSIYKSIRDRKLVPDNVIHKCADKLIDIKLMFCYLNTTDEYFYRGPTRIVGCNELEKLNPNTMSLLRGNHYKVYLISVILENILDFLQLVLYGKVVDYKKGKWEKILIDVRRRRTIDAINDKNIEVLLAFKKKYRTAELHKFSAVRAFTAQDKWNHFQVEADIVRDIILGLTSFFKDG